MLATYAVFVPKNLNTNGFPARIVELRKEKGFTQQQLAERIGVHVQQLKRYEAGASQPTLDVIRNLAILHGRQNTIEATPEAMHYALALHPVDPPLDRGDRQRKRRWVDRQLRAQRNQCRQVCRQRRYERRRHGHDRVPAARADGSTPGAPAPRHDRSGR